MRIILDHTANSIFFLLGSMHAVLTLLNQRPFDLDALMYVGAGLAFIFLSFLNFVRVKTNHSLTKLFSVIANILTVLYIALIAVAFVDPRVTIAIAMLLLLVVLSIVDYKTNVNTVSGSAQR